MCLHGRDGVYEERRVLKVKTGDSLLYLFSGTRVCCVQEMKKDSGGMKV